LKNFINFLTYSRIILTPIIIYLIYTNNYTLAAIVFAYCSFSDVADGRLARKHNLVTEKGNYLDPLADKILMIGTLTILAYQGIILLWAYCIIIGRDILITMYRNYLIEKNKPLVTSKYGKWKTVFQHVMVIVILLNNPTQDIINLIVSLNAIYAAATGFEYVFRNGF
jgi:CDP-diacylglycerol--glycerol-3-phosphate 3-phosphatidyltransferase